MSKFNTFQNSFIGGQISRKMQGRYDTKDYSQSVEEMTNMLSQKIGGSFMRTGFLNYYDLGGGTANLDPTKQYTIIPFIVSRDVTYDLILINEYIPLSHATFTDKIKLLRNKESQTDAIEVLTLSKALSSTPEIADWGLSNNGNPLVGHWKYSQVGDIIFICHSSGKQKPLVIFRVSDTAFTVSYYTEFFNDINIILQRPYKPVNVTPITMTYDSTAGTVTASAVFFDPGMVGNFLKINFISTTLQTGLVVLGTFNSSTEMDIAATFDAIPNPTTTDNWSIQAWDDFEGWPSSVAAFEQRMYWSGVDGKVFGSLTGNLFHMMSERFEEDKEFLAEGDTPTGDQSALTPKLNYFGDIKSTDPFDFRPASQQANEIRWMIGAKALLMGSLGSEYIASGYQSTLSLESADVKQHTYYGSSDNQVIQTGKDVIFVTRDGRSLRSYRFSDENGSYLSDDLNSRSDDIFWRLTETNLGNNIEIKQIIWQPDNSIIWVVTTSGDLFSLVYEPEFGITSWSRHPLGQAVAGEANKPLVMSISILPNPTGVIDQVHMMVLRPFAQGDVLFLEKMVGEFENTTMSVPLPGGLGAQDIRDFPRYMDNMVVQEVIGGEIALGSEAEDVVYTLLHYNPNALAAPILTTGTPDNTGTIFTGPLNIPDGNIVMSGLVYEAKIKTNSLEAGGEFGTAEAQIKRVDRTTLKLYKTERFKIKASHSIEDETVIFDNIFTGDRRVNLSSNPDTVGQVEITSVGPYPLNILSLVQRGVTYEG